MTNQTVKDRIDSLINDIADGNKAEFARQLGVTSQDIDRWFNKKSAPGPKFLPLFYERLNLNIYWLLTGEGNKYLPAAGQAAEPREVYSRRLDHLSKDEREYTEKLIQILRTKRENTVIAIKNNIDAFLDNPDAQKKESA